MIRFLIFRWRFGIIMRHYRYRFTLRGADRKKWIVDSEFIPLLSERASSKSTKWVEKKPPNVKLGANRSPDSGGHPSFKIIGSTQRKLVIKTRFCFTNPLSLTL